MADSINPEWLDACGFVRTRGYRATDCLYEKFFEKDRRYGMTASFDASLKAEVCMMGPGRQVIALNGPTRSVVRAAWHALTGTRLVEPMPAEIAESTLILADKYEDDGFGDQAAYVRSLVSENERLKREIDEWHNDSITASALDTQVSEITSELPRPRFANDSYRFRYCERCRGCTQHVFLSQQGFPHAFECLSCNFSGFDYPNDKNRPVPMIRDESGWRPCGADEAASAYTTAGELEDALNNGRTAIPMRINNDAWQGHPDD